MIKLAVIRSDLDRACPFGLAGIPFVCKKAGNSVDEMTAIKIDDFSDNSDIIKSNIKIYKSNPEQKPCRYAANFFNEKNVIDCDYGDTAAGMSQNDALTPSEYTTHPLSPTSMDGLFSYPFASEYDLGITRNPYYGTYSFAEDRAVRQKNRMKIWSSIKLK